MFPYAQKFLEKIGRGRGWGGCWLHWVNFSKYGIGEQLKKAFSRPAICKTSRLVFWVSLWVYIENVET